VYAGDFGRPFFYEVKRVGRLCWEVAPPNVGTFGTPYSRGVSWYVKITYTYFRRPSKIGVHDIGGFLYPHRMKVKEKAAPEEAALQSFSQTFVHPDTSGLPLVWYLRLRVWNLVGLKSRIRFLLPAFSRKYLFRKHSFLALFQCQPDKMRAFGEEFR